VILRSEVVEQVVDGSLARRFLKDVVMTPGATPLGMVRKRLPDLERTRGTVVLVHGFGQNRYAFHSSTRSFSNFLAADGWDVFNTDLRGHGRSRRFGAKRPELLSEYVKQDLPAVVREALRLSTHDHVWLVGHSMGGIVSYAAAATTLRDRVAGVVSIGSPYRFGQGSILLAAFARTMTLLRATGVFDSNPSLPLRIVGRHFHKRRRFWNSALAPLPLRPWKPGSMEDDLLDDYLRKAFDWTSVEIAFDIFQSGREGMVRTSDGATDVATAFEHLDKPLLVLAGSEDDLAPPSSVRPAYDRSRSSDKTYRVFPAGHVDIVLGKSAPFTIWPTIGRWLARREELRAGETWTENFLGQGVANRKAPS
jgi:pimeloyl-ACP methyl ester carboxylesterase